MTIEPVSELGSWGALRLPRAGVVPMSAPPASYTAAVERYLTGAADTVNRELSIARKAIGWWQRQGWIGADPTIGIERRPAPPDRTKALALNQIAALWRLDVALREKTQWKMLYESAARADEVLRLNVEDLYPQDKRGRSPPRAGRPNGSTGSPEPPSSCPASSPAAPAARCSSPTAKRRPEHRRSTCARRPAGPGSPTTALRRTPGCWPTPRLTRQHRGSGQLDTPPAPAQRPHARRRGRHLHPDTAARSRHASVRSLERYARPGVDSVARHVAERDPATRRRT